MTPSSVSTCRWKQYVPSNSRIAHNTRHHSVHYDYTLTGVQLVDQKSALRSSSPCQPHPEPVSNQVSATNRLSILMKFCRQVPYHQQHGYGVQETSERVQGVEEVGEGTLQPPPPLPTPPRHLAVLCSTVLFLMQKQRRDGPGRSHVAQPCTSVCLDAVRSLVRQASKQAPAAHSGNSTACVLLLN